MVKKLRVKNLILVAMFAGLTAIGAFIKIPIPFIPITLQFLFCAYSGILLGARGGLYSQLVYLGIGLMGIPIFTKGGGPAYILEPTFGFLIGFALCSYIIGRLTENLREYRFYKILIPVLVGLSGLYLCGLAHLYFIMNFYLHEPMSLKALIGVGLIPFIPTDLLSVIIASASSVHILPILNRAGLLPASE